jgi:hypothetical protein
MFGTVAEYYNQKHVATQTPLVDQSQKDIDNAIKIYGNPNLAEGFRKDANDLITRYLGK